MGPFPFYLLLLRLLSPQSQEVKNVLRNVDKWRERNGVFSPLFNKWIESSNERETAFGLNNLLNTRNSLIGSYTKDEPLCCSHAS